MQNQEHDWQADLDRFRAACQVERRTIDGHAWEYIRCGSGAEAVLILPGGLAVAETAFRYIGRLETHYRVLAPTYPETISTMAQLAGGLAQLMQIEQIVRAHVVGGSYSGLVAQCLVRCAPKLVNKLVLADTGVPRRWRARQFGPLRPLMERAPLPVLRLIARGSLAMFLRRLPAQRAFWRRYFAKRVRTMTRAAFASHLAVWRDFDRTYEFTARDLADWHGRILIVEAEHDGLFGRRERAALRALYPSAKLHTFARRSHGASLAYMDDYITVIERFLSGS
jgi:pimeloyl-ACP methyl ester carboxylesterase